MEKIFQGWSMRLHPNVTASCQTGAARSRTFGDEDHDCISMGHWTDPGRCRHVDGVGGVLTRGGGNDMSGTLGSSVWSGGDPGSQVMSDEVRSQRSRQLWEEDPALYAWVSEITAMPPLARSLQTGDLNQAWRNIDDDPEELGVLARQMPFTVVGLLDRNVAERQRLAEDPEALYAAILEEQAARHQRFQDSACRLMAVGTLNGRPVDFATLASLYPPKVLARLLPGEWAAHQAAQVGADGSGDVEMTAMAAGGTRPAMTREEAWEAIADVPPAFHAAYDALLEMAEPARYGAILDVLLGSAGTSGDEEVAERSDEDLPPGMPSQTVLGKRKAASDRKGEGAPVRRPRLDPVPLGATDWLGDEHIAADYALLTEELWRQNPLLAAEARFVPPAVVHLLRHAEPGRDLEEALGGIYRDGDGQDTARYLFLPVNNGDAGFGGTHWSLLFVDRGHPQGPQAHHYDSLPGFAQFDIAGQLAGRLGVTTPLWDGQMARQSNGYDCGVAVLAATRELVARLARGQAPEAATLHLGDVVADRPVLQARLGGRRQNAVEESHPEPAPSSDPGLKPKRRSRAKLDEKIAGLVPQAMAAGFELSREECERIGKRSGGSLALKALVDKAEALSGLAFAGETPGETDKLGKADILKILGNNGAAQAVEALLKHAGALSALAFAGDKPGETEKLGKADILKILGNDGAARAVEALLQHAERLKHMSKSTILKAASKYRGAASAIRNLN